jgi:hypothetical protein
LIARHLIALALLAALAPCLSAAGADGPVATLSFDPPSVKLAPGERQMIAVRVDGIPESGLAAFQLLLRFQPGEVEVADPNAAFASSGVPAFAPLGHSPACAAIRQKPVCPDPEWMLTATGRQPFGTSSIDAREGTLTIAYGTAGETAPVAGSGTLALIEVIGTGRGEASFKILEAILADGSDPPGKYAFAIAPGDKPGSFRQRR